MGEPAIAESTESGYVIRRAAPEEIAKIVLPSWIQSYTRSLIAKFCRADGRYSGGRDRYWSAMEGRINRILATTTTRVRVVDADGMVAAWCCDDETNRTIHYLYVKEPFRRQGLARSLAIWLEDPSGGAVIVNHMPPPFYTRTDETTHRRLWREHVVIDLLTSY